MSKRLLSAVLILLSSYSISPAQGEWIRIAPTGGGFSVTMPAQPKEETKVDDVFSSHSFSMMTDKTVYIVEYGDYAPSVRLDVPGELAANRDNFVKGIDGKLLESKEVTLNGRPGLEFTAESSQLSAKSRVYLFGNRVWMIAAAVLKGTTDTENVDRFFASFAFTGDIAHPKP